MAVICRLYIIEATDLATQHWEQTLCLYCGHSFTLIKFITVGTPEVDIHVQVCCPGTHEKLYIINS